MSDEGISAAKQKLQLHATLRSHQASLASEQISIERAALRRRTTTIFDDDPSDPILRFDSDPTDPVRRAIILIAKRAALGDVGLNAGVSTQMADQSDHA